MTNGDDGPGGVDGWNGDPHLMHVGPEGIRQGIATSTLSSPYRHLVVSLSCTLGLKAYGKVLQRQPYRHLIVTLSSPYPHLIIILSSPYLPISCTLGPKAYGK
eukprot:1849130-Pyramimonas_sp.AAC.1